MLLSVEANPVQMRFQCFQSAVIANSKLDYCLCTAHASQGGRGQRLAEGGVCMFVTFAQSITFKSITLQFA